MPTGIYKRKTGYKLSEKHKQSLRDGKKRFFDNGGQPWSKGKTFSKGYREKLSKAHKKQVAWNKGQKGVYSKETLKKMSDNRKGKPSYIRTEQIIKKMSKENHWNWKGGTSFQSYTLDWSKTLRISIRERDKYTCGICDEKQGDSVFAVHHIDYDKKNCNPDNLITLCNSCHSKTNYKREYWILFFSNKKL